ncbi:unnamed protein product [Ixodes pacificus]
MCLTYGLLSFSASVALFLSEAPTSALTIWRILLQSLPPCPMARTHGATCRSLVPQRHDHVIVSEARQLHSCLATTVPEWFDRRPRERTARHKRQLAGVLSPRGNVVQHTTCGRCRPGSPWRRRWRPGRGC